MSNTIELKKREELGTTKARELRRKQLIPGVIYGDSIENRHFFIEERQIPRLKKASELKGLIDVQIIGEDSPVKAIIQKIQKNAVSGKNQHIDLYQVRMDRKLHTEVGLEFVGESPAVEDLGGILVKQYDRIPVECLPKDLIHSIEVPIDGLKTFQDVIQVKDIQFPQAVETPLDGEDIVASVSEPRSEEELEELESEVSADVEEVEVSGEKKEEAEQDSESAEAAEESVSGEEEKEEEKKE